MVIVILLKVKLDFCLLGILLFVLYMTCFQIMSAPTFMVTAFLKLTGPTNTNGYYVKALIKFFLWSEILLVLFLIRSYVSR